MATTCTKSRALDFGPSDPATFKVCSFLVNVLSQMYEQWENAKFPQPSWGVPFNWQPANCPCQVTKNFVVGDYQFWPLIWSSFNPGNKLGMVTEPFGAIVQHQEPGGNVSFYLVFRGSKSDADFAADFETLPMAYTAPTPNPPSDIQVGTGWYAVYNGLLEALRINLQQVVKAGGKLLTITGHSLGSTLATLAVAEAVAQSLQVRHYNSASPKVGQSSFKTYYDSLVVPSSSTAPGLLETYRLVNVADVVPNFPLLHDYVHVGTQVSFNANYGNEVKTHDPCCSYAYAIYNPERPCNPDYDGCAGNDKK